MLSRSVFSLRQLSHLPGMCRGRRRHSLVFAGCGPFGVLFRPMACLIVSLLSMLQDGGVITTGCSRSVLLSYFEDFS